MSDARGRTLVQYEFGLSDGSTRSFSVEVGPDRVDSGPAEPPPWAALDFHKCPHCPLDVAEEPFCPAAMSIASLAEAVDGLWSHDIVSLKVRTPERFNAVALLYVLAQMLPKMLDDSLAPIRPLFSSYFAEDEIT